jgi:hypothetical protein
MPGIATSNGALAQKFPKMWAAKARSSCRNAHAMRGTRRSIGGAQLGI